jgi:hypothetical protein
VTVNVLIGPPLNRQDDDKVMSLFFSQEGRHIVCGGTTANIVAKYLGKDICVSLDYERDDVPPIAKIEGVDLVTEGIVTLGEVVRYVRDCLGENKMRKEWIFKEDGASLISRVLIEEATDINFYIGKAVNPSHKEQGLINSFIAKMKHIEELYACLKKIGKNVIVSYF